MLLSSHCLLYDIADFVFTVICIFPGVAIVVISVADVVAYFAVNAFFSFCNLEDRRKQYRYKRKTGGESERGEGGEKKEEQK